MQRRTRPGVICSKIPHQGRLRRIFFGCVLIPKSLRSVPSLATDLRWASAAERYVCSRLNGVAGCIMPEYRCNMLNQHGDILFPSDIVAESLDAALQDAVDVFRKCNEGWSTSG